MQDMTSIANILGGYLPGSEPQFMEAGLALHITVLSLFLFALALGPSTVRTVLSLILLVKCLFIQNASVICGNKIHSNHTFKIGGVG